MLSAIICPVHGHARATTAHPTLDAAAGCRAHARRNQPPLDKTTLRQLYEEQLTQARARGFDEVLFLNQRGELTEGAISNLLLEQSGKLLTPPLHCGVLPGVMRRHLLESFPNASLPCVEERVLTLADLHTADAVWLCNSLRGLRKATFIAEAP